MPLNPFTINKTTSKSASFFRIFLRFLLIFVRKTILFHPESDRKRPRGLLATGYWLLAGMRGMANV
jgi:hypothetical protein